MGHKRIVLCIALAMISLGVVVSGLWSADTTASQGAQTDRDGTIMVANATISATLRAKTQTELRGRISLHFEASPDELKQGVIAVRQFNVVFPGVPQAALSGRAPKTTGKNGPLGMSIPASEKSVRLRYDAQSQTISGEIPVQVHFPQIDEIYPPEFVKDGRESDFAISRTQKGRLKLELRLAEPPDKAAARSSQRAAAKLTARASARVEVEALGDIPPYVIEFRQVAWIIDIGVVRLFEAASRLCIQPVRIRSSASDASPTGTGLAFGMPGAHTQWNKADIVFQVREWMVVTNSSWKIASEGAEETSIRGSVNVSDCIEVFFVQNFSPEDLHGGGATWSSGTASAKIISSDGNATFGVDLTHLAHELGHVLNMGHPGNPFGLFDPSTNTLMCPSGWHNDNPKRQSTDNKLNAANPLLVWTLKTISAGPNCNSNADCGGCP